MAKPLWGEERVTVQLPDGGVCSLPIGWTDAAPPDPYVDIGKGRARFRVEDLLALAEFLGMRGAR